MSLERAISQAERSPQKRFQTGCVITDRHGRQLGNGWSHKGAAAFTEFWSVHAELHAIMRGQYNLAEYTPYGPYTAYVARITRKSGLLNNAKPCLQCALLLYQAGVREVVYTVKGNTETVHLASVPDIALLGFKPTLSPATVAERNLRRLREDGT